MAFKCCIAFAYAAVLGAGVLLVSDAASARGGGAHAGFHFGRPFAGMRPFVRPAARIHAFKAARLWRYRNVDGFGYPLYGAGYYYGPDYDPVDAVGSIGQPPYPYGDDDTSVVPNDGMRVAPVRRVCWSEIKTVPSESGGERQVTITRC